MVLVLIGSGLYGRGQQPANLASSSVACLRSVAAGENVGQVVEVALAPGIDDDDGADLAKKSRDARAERGPAERACRAKRRKP